MTSLQRESWVQADKDPLYLGEEAILATMHGKERMIAPLLRRELGLAKGLIDEAEVERAVRDVAARCGAAFVEADMRAHQPSSGLAQALNCTRVNLLQQAVQRVHLVLIFRCL